MNTKKTVFSGLFWRFGEGITSQLVTLLVSMFLARLLSPNDFGAVALVMVFITLANVFVSNGFGNALIQKKDADNLDFSSVLYINIAVSIVLYAILFICAPFIAGFYGIPILSPVLRVLGIRIPIAAVNSIQHAYVSRNMLFKRFFWSTLIGTVLSGIAGVIMAYKGFGIWALVAQYLINTLTDTIVLWFTVKWRPVLACSWKRAKPLIKYGWKLLVSGLLDTGYTQLRSLLIGILYTSEDLAFYKQGETYPQLISAGINSTIGSVLFPAMSQLQDDKDKIKEFTRRSIQTCSYVIWPLMFGIAAVSVPLVRVLFTEKWLPCVPFLCIFCLSYGFWPIHTANLQAINALGRSDIFLKLEIIKKVYGLVFLLVSLPFGPLGIAGGLIVTDIISVFVNAAPNVKLLGYSFGEQISDLFSPFILSLIMAAVVFPISQTGLNDITVLLIQVFCGIAVYLIGSVISKQKGYLYILDFLKKREKKQ